MTTRAELCLQRPDLTHGTPVGIDDWRLVVELAGADSAGAKWGVSDWGTSAWSAGFQWFDITCDVRGLRWTRGIESPGERPRIGTLTATIDNRTSTYSSWNEYTPFAAGNDVLDSGTLIRVTLNDPTDVDEPANAGRWGSSVWGTGVWWAGSQWLPQITARVETWEESTEEDADRWITVTAIETLSFLAPIDADEGAAQGAGEVLTQRVGRILDQSGWPFPSLRAGTVWETSGTTSDVTLQATTFAQDRITDLYLAADSAGGHVFSDRDGAPRLWPKSYRALPLVDASTRLVAGERDEIIAVWADAPFDLFGGTADRLRVLPMLMDGFTVNRDFDAIVNYVAWARDGGTQQTAVVDRPSLYRHGPHTNVRGDIICQTDAQVLEVMQEYFDGQTRETHQLAGVGFYINADNFYPVLVDADVDLFHELLVLREVRKVTGTIPVMFQTTVIGTEHTVTPLTDSSVSWRVTLNVQTDDWTSVPDLPSGFTPNEPAPVEPEPPAAEALDFEQIEYVTGASPFVLTRKHRVAVWTATATADGAATIEVASTHGSPLLPSGDAGDTRLFLDSYTFTAGTVVQSPTPVVSDGYGATTPISVSFGVAPDAGNTVLAHAAWWSYSGPYTVDATGWTELIDESLTSTLGLVMGREAKHDTAVAQTVEWVTTGDEYVKGLYAIEVDGTIDDDQHTSAVGTGITTTATLPIAWVAGDLIVVIAAQSLETPGPAPTFTITSEA